MIDESRFICSECGFQSSWENDFGICGDCHKCQKCCECIPSLAEKEKEADDNFISE